MTGTIAAFDVDGTLAVGDTFLPFAAAVAGRARLAVAFGASGTALLRARRPGGRDELKAAVVRHLFAGRRADALDVAGERFAERVHARGLRPDVLERLRWHQAHGHHTVLVSASLACYLRPLGRRLGVDQVLCTELAVVEGVLTGELAGANCRGPEKARRLAGLRAAAGEMWAYGNDDGDRDMLALADHPVLVARRSPLAPLDVDTLVVAS